MIFTRQITANETDLLAGREFFSLAIFLDDELSFVIEPGEAWTHDTLEEIATALAEPEQEKHKAILERYKISLHEYSTHDFYFKSQDGEMEWIGSSEC